jgi:hypothetical protein
MVEMIIGNGEVIGNGGATYRRSEPEASRIRNNLMFKLGVESDKSGKEVQREPSRGSLLGNVQLSKEPLKYVEDEAGTATEGGRLWNIASMFTKRASLSETEVPLSSSCTSRDSSCSTEGSQTRRLTFNEEVAVCPIPKRDEYSKRIRERLWATPDEMMSNAYRNSVEFAAEGWDWRNVMEDENMYRCVASNELIHPVHVERQQPEQTSKSE